MALNMLRLRYLCYRFLILPRIASQAHFEEICPTETVRNRKRLCSILLTAAGGDELHIDAYRSFVETNGLLLRDRVRFAYMFADKQSVFLESMSATQLPIDRSMSRDLLILWRNDRQRSRYLWLEDGWSGHPDGFNKSVEKLSRTIAAYLIGSALADKEAVLKVKLPVAILSADTFRSLISTQDFLLYKLSSLLSSPYLGNI